MAPKPDDTDAPDAPYAFSDAALLAMDDDALLSWLLDARAPPAASSFRDGKPRSAIDPPFAELHQRLTDLAQRLDEELDAITDTHDEWHAVASNYGFEPPEALITIAVLAAIRPELRELVDKNPDLTRTELGAWLLTNLTTRRVLTECVAWLLAGISTEETTHARSVRAKRAREMIGSVFDRLGEYVLGDGPMRDAPNAP
jgi:hypothetical protein